MSRLSTVWEYFKLVMSISLTIAIIVTLIFTYQRVEMQHGGSLIMQIMIPVVFSLAGLKSFELLIRDVAKIKGKN